jgi:catechol 2,3-dioxygenase-like lactoylglutathione lyase family enzyme
LARTEPAFSRLDALPPVALQTSNFGVILPAMNAKGLTPILNVSDIAASFAWFEKWGWRKCWDWGTPPTFGAVGSGECEIFLCEGAQGGRGKGTNTTTFQKDGDEASDKGAWMSVWVDDVDEVHRQCVAAGLDVTFPPTNMPWNVREMHVRHPDGHVFRVSKGTEKS